MLPLIVVIGMSGAKDYIEDRKRKRADREENESIVLVANKLEKTFEAK